MEQLIVIGCGPGDESQLTDSAKKTLNTAQRILSTGRLSGGDKHIHCVKLSDLATELKVTGKGKTAVLVGGDCGFFSAAKIIIRDFSELYDIELIPGISSFQYMSAKINTSYDDAVLISLHGRNGNIVPKAAYNKKCFVLTGGANSASAICDTLSRYGLGGVSVSVGERLSYPDERITTGKASELKERSFDRLSIMYIENAAAVNPHMPLRDSDFERGGVPMTKEEIRWLSISRLCVRPDDIVYDIGAGTGSVSVELARKAFEGFVYAIDSNEEACALTSKNAARHGAFNIGMVRGEAPDALEGLPVPDRAFIGGSSGNMDGIVQKLTSLNPGVIIVANAITIQTLNDIIEGFKKHGLTNTDIICVNVAKAKKTGGYDMMLAQNPVYIITGQRQEAAQPSENPCGKEGGGNV